MNLPSIELLDEAQCSVLETTLVDLIYHFNADSTGYFDGRLLGGRISADTGELLGAFHGHTWGGVSVISHLWVAERCRRIGVGNALLTAAETEARRRHCVDSILMTHSFQAPPFYERAGYRSVCSIEEWPIGHSTIVYRKRLDGACELIIT